MDCISSSDSRFSLLSAESNTRFSASPIRAGAPASFARARPIDRIDSSIEERSDDISPEKPGGADSAAAGEGGVKYLRGSHATFRPSAGRERASETAASTSATVRLSWSAAIKSGICRSAGSRLR